MIKALFRRFLLVVIFLPLYFFNKLVWDWATLGHLSRSLKDFPYFFGGVLIADTVAAYLRYLQRSKDRESPPVSAQFFFYVFLEALSCDALIGDLEERYKSIFKKFGAGRANVWYWTQVIRSVGPIASAWTRKVALKPIIGVITWAVAKGLVGHDSWLAALVEMWRRIRS